MKARLLLAALGLLATLGSPGIAAAQDVWPPSTVASLNLVPGRHTMVAIWTSPGDDCNEGTAAAYELRYSTSAINAGNFASATLITTGNPVSAGGEECEGLTSLTPNTLYYFAIRTRDEASNWSPLTFASESTNPSGPEEACL